MDVPTMTMARGPAMHAVEEYEDAIKSGKAYPGDESLLEGYRAMARGKVVIDLLECFAATGLGADGKPKLAICRADARRCCLRVSPQEIQFQADRTWVSDAHHRHYVKVPRAVFRGAPGTAIRGANVYGHPEVLEGEAMVPSIPPRCRPKGSLKPYLILWEAVWQKNPPRDPFLLRPLRWPLFWVVAQWDLTPLEMSILRSLRVSP